MRNLEQWHITIMKKLLAGGMLTTAELKNSGCDVRALSWLSTIELIEPYLTGWRLTERGTKIIGNC